MRYLVTLACGHVKKLTYEPDKHTLIHCVPCGKDKLVKSVREEL